MAHTVLNGAEIDLSLPPAPLSLLTSCQASSLNALRRHLVVGHSTQRNEYSDSIDALGRDIGRKYTPGSRNRYEGHAGPH